MYGRAIAPSDPPHSKPMINVLCIYLFRDELYVYYSTNSGNNLIFNLAFEIVYKF